MINKYKYVLVRGAAYCILLFFVFVLLAGCRQDENKIAVIVDRVIDGDTINVKVGNETKTVRLLLIDTPESVHPTKAVQPFGKEASNYLKALLPSGTRVELEYDVNKTDKYDRMLAYVWLENQLVNKLLVEQGLARVAYVYKPNVKYEIELKKTEEQARRNEIGIWSIAGYVSDQGFSSDVQVSARNESSSATGCDNPTIKGNITRSGEKIYHTPASPQYKATKAEEMFCTEEAAMEEGFRKAAS